MEYTGRKKQIIETAIGLIADHGIQSLTTKRLATEIGFTEPSLYRHFKNKNAIILAILDTFSSTVSQDAFAGDTPLARIENFILGRYDFFSENPKFAKVMFSEAAFQNEPELSRKVMQVMHKHKDAMVDNIVEGQRDGSFRDDIEPKELFRIIVGPFRLTVTQWCLSGYLFNLKDDGYKLWDSTKLIIRK